MILVPYFEDGETEFSPADFEALWHNVRDFLKKFWDCPSVEPLYGSNAKPFGLLIRSEGAAYHALTVFKALTPVC